MSRAMGEPVRVLLVDDQPLVRMGLALVLDSTEDIMVVGEGSHGGEGVTLVDDLRPDIVMMDVRMPLLDGIEATRRITTQHPRTRVIVLTTYDLDEYAFGGLRAGASAFLLKSTPPEVLTRSVRLVAQGDCVVEPRITRQLIDHYTRQSRDDQPRRSIAGRASVLNVLTPREHDIFRAIARGSSNPEICADFHLSAATVKTHVNRIFSKLDLRDRVQAVILAYQLGVAPATGERPP